MIRAKVATQSSTRDDAIQYLQNELATKDWVGWKRNGDIFLTVSRVAGGRVWRAHTTMIVGES